MTTPCIAVVIPAFNAQLYIGDALDSVARQSRKPNQLIVVDDGSTDATVSCVRAWVGRTKIPVDLLQQENRGPAAGRNRGIRHTSAELVACLDADDVFLPHHLEVLSRAFARPTPPVLSFGDGESFTGDAVLNPSLLTNTAVETLEYEEDADGFRMFRGSLYASLVSASYIPPSATVFQRVAAEAVGLFDESLRSAEDREFYLRLSRVGRFGCFPKVVFRKRVHGENLTHVKNRATFRRYQLLVLQKMLRQAHALSLTAGEIQVTRRALEEQAWMMLYHASESGLGPFLSVCGFLARQGLVRSLAAPRHWLRAVAFSTVREKRFR